MATSARDVAAALRDAIPGLPVMKLHKLLYYCQGHHLAHHDRPLFTDTISAWDMGPVVGTLWFAERNTEEPPPSPPPQPLTNGELNTVGYVVSRYGNLSGLDLQHLTHAEDPWLLADRTRSKGDSVRIELDWMRQYFRDVASVREEDEISFGRERIAEVTAGAAERYDRLGPPGPDETPRLQARLEALRASA
jgi:uncharacterized phage-associated protein